MTTQYFVIGAGSIGRRHHENLTALGAQSRLVGWREIDLAGLEATLASVDSAAMVIATATQIRKELIAICARTGTPFYVEKPLAYRMEDLDHIYQVAESVADRSMVGFMMRYHPVMRTLVADPVLAYDFRFEIGHDVRQWRANWRFGDSYAAQSEGGGVMLDLCHEIDIAHCLYPDAALQSVHSLGHADFPGVDFSTTVTLATPCGPLGTVRMDYLSPQSIRKAYIRGRKEVLDLDWLAPSLTRYDGQTARAQDWVFERNDMFTAIMADFMALAEGRTPSDNPLMPRFDRMYQSSALIARAWQAREFHGVIKGGFDG